MFFFYIYIIILPSNKNRLAPGKVVCRLIQQQARILLIWKNPGKSVGKRKTPKPRTLFEKDFEEAECFYCNDLYSRSRAKEGRIRCSECLKWAYEACADFICEICLAKRRTQHLNLRDGYPQKKKKKMPCFKFAYSGTHNPKFGIQFYYQV